MQLSCGFRRESTSNHLFCSFSASGQETQLLPPQQQCQVKAPLFFSDISLSSKIIAVAVGYVWLLLVGQGLIIRVAPREFGVDFEKIDPQASCSSQCVLQ